MLRFSKLSAGILAVALLATLTVSCVAPTPGPITPTRQWTPVPEPTAAATPTTEPSAPKIGAIKMKCEEELMARMEKLRQTSTEEALSMYKGLIYVEGQLILGGQMEAINETATLLEDAGIKLVTETKPVALTESEVSQLYMIASKDPVELVTCIVNKIPDQFPLLVYADPNYHTSPAGWHGGGSPWTQNGVWAQDGGGLGKASSAEFASQWAFGSDGIHLLDTSLNRTTKRLGDGTVIGVFDTSPFAQVPSEEECTDCDLDQYFEPSIRGSDTVSNPIILQDMMPQNSPTCPGKDKITKEDREPYDLSSHGLFVAGLAQAVAPNSQIYLVRVLADDACGDLDTILRGLEWFKQAMIASPSGSLRDTVVNLSLGVHHPDDWDGLGLPETVKTLSLKIQDLIDSGAIVVAASGNDSYLTYPDALQAEVPAIDDRVISVAASTSKQERSCYSNQALLAAPGGNGVPNAKIDLLCAVPGKDSAGEWPCEIDPTLCVVSLVRDPATQQIGFAHWVGTSFATPMVSGLYALLLQAGATPTEASDAIELNVMPVVDVRPYVETGIINVEDSVPR